jgi:hypothetical protein
VKKFAAGQVVRKRRTELIGGRAFEETSAFVTVT